MKTDAEHFKTGSYQLSINFHRFQAFVIKFHIMNKIILTLCLSILYSVTAFSQTTDNNGDNPSAYNDGPYIFYKEDVHIYSAMKTDTGMKVNHDIKSLQDLKDLEFTVNTNTELPAFKVKLFKYKDSPSTYKQMGKTVVISDIHGNFFNYVKLLKNAGVISDNYTWTFGKNKLVINGDIFDRGVDVTAVLWLTYKLDAESGKAGGSVIFNFGNHEDMVLTGDFRYVDEKYDLLSKRIGVDLTEFFSRDTELGRWLRTKNVMTTVGDILFVHGGISTEVVKSGLKPEKINEIMRNGIGMALNPADSIVIMLFGDRGPMWYRGLVTPSGTELINADTIDVSLSHFKVSRIVVGHTTLSRVSALHGGRVIGVDAAVKEALIIDKNKFAVLTTEGEYKELPVSEGFYKKY